MRLHRVALAGVCLIGAAFVVILISGEQTPGAAVRSSTSRSPSADPITALQREIDRLKAKIEHPPIAQRSPEPPREAGGTAAPAAPGPTSQLSSDYQPADVAQILEAHYSSERGDQTWSDRVNAELSVALGAQRTGTTLSSTRCAASLCKVTLLHDNAAAQVELASHVATLPALSAGVFYHYEDDADPPRTVLYIVREGHDFQEMLAAR